MHSKDIHYSPFEMGARLRRLIKERGYTQEKFANKVHISSSFLKSVIAGSKSVSVPVLIDMAKELGVTTDYLLFGEQNREEP